MILVMAAPTASLVFTSPTFSAIPLDRVAVEIFLLPVNLISWTVRTTSAPRAAPAVGGGAFCVPATADHNIDVTIMPNRNRAPLFMFFSASAGMASWYGMMRRRGNQQQGVRIATTDQPS